MYFYIMIDLTNRPMTSFFFQADLDVFSGFWDTVLISTTLSLSLNSSYNTSKDECIKQASDCLGFGLWSYGYFLLNGNSLVGGGFGPSVMFLKSGTVTILKIFLQIFKIIE